MCSGRARVLSLVVLLLLSAASLLRVPGRADPITINNGDGTSDAVWNFATPGDYALANTQISGGTVSLASATTWWNSTTAPDFAGPDAETNVDRSTWPGDVALASPSGPMTLLALQPGVAGEDAWLDRNNGNTNHGADTTMVLDGRNPQSRPVLRFDLSAIPAGTVIDDAILSLYQSAGIGNPFVASVYQVSATWDEMQVTWNDRLTGTGWTTAGGDFSGHVIGQTTLDNTPGWRSWNVTQLVDLWYRGRVPNQGLILNAAGTGSDSDKTFYTSDYGVDPTRRPRLDIRYRILGGVGEYISRVGGPGLPALWQTIAWNGTGRSLVDDEFAGPGLDPRWTWTNPPAAYDVDVTTTGALHVVSSTGVDFNGAAFTGSVLANDVVGDFTATTKLTSDSTVSGQKAGLMVLLGSRDWYAAWKMNVAGNVRWRVSATADAVTTARVDLNNGNPIPAWLRIQRVGTTFTAYTSTDGTVWTLRDTYTPGYEYPLSVRLALTFADGGSGTAHTADVDYLRVAFGGDATVSVSTRTGDTTPVDGTWSGWTAPYATAAGSAMAGSSRFVEYRLSFAVTYPDHVPVVGDVNLSWFRYAVSGTVETNDLVLSDLASWGAFTTVHALNGQAIAYEYSLDSGSAWTPVNPPADLSAVSPATGRIRFRVTMSTADTLISPTVSEIRISYTHLLDHFYVTADGSAAAGSPFSVTVTAKDALNATIASWTGIVTLAARLLDGVTPGAGALGTTNAMIAAGGTVTVATESYTKAESIRILASFGSTTGLSGPVVISPGSVTRITVTPGDMNLLPFDAQVFVGDAFDAYDNPVPGVSFNWTVGGGVGTVNASAGPSVLFTASPPPANGTLEASFGGMNATAQVHVVSGLPPWILISAPASGAHMTGLVPILYTNSSDAVSARFEYDGGAGWTLIGMTAILDGTYTWDTSPLDFAAGALRVIVTNNRTISNTTVVTPIEVDNTSPSIAIGGVTDNQAVDGTLTILYATDPDVVRVDFTYFDGAWNLAGTDLTPDGSHVWTPGMPINGVTLRAVAEDDVGLLGADEEQGVGTFVVGSNPPTIAPIPIVYVESGSTYSLNLTFYVSDPDTPRAALVVWDSDPANVTANAGAFPDLDILYASPGTYLVTLWVSDGTDIAWRIVQIVASADRPPVVVAAPPSVAFDEDTTAWNALGAPAIAFFNDSDGDPLTFAVLDGGTVLSQVNGNGTVDLWAVPNWFGARVLRLRASDPAGAFAEAAFDVTVGPIDDTPVLVTAFSAAAFDEDMVLTDAFGGDAATHFTDVDGDPVAVAVLGGVNVLSRVNGDGTIDLWAVSNWSGSETLRIRATDPLGLFAEGTVLVTVRPVNDAPVLASPVPAAAFDEDTTLTDALGGSASSFFFDREGSPLTVSILGASQFLSRVNGDGTIDLWGAANWSGSESLLVRAADPEGAFVDAPWSVTVSPVNDAPVLAAVPALSIDEGASRVFDLSPYVSDVDTPTSGLVVTTNSPYVRANGLVLTIGFPSNVTAIQLTVTVSDGFLAASQPVRVTIVPPIWKPVVMTVTPVALAVVVGVFVQRARWRPAKAFLVDEKRQMLREFTLDRTCDVTFEQAVGAGALDAVEQPVKVAKYHAQTVRGDALAVTLLAYGPVSKEQIEFAREMLVNVQDKFDDQVTARLEEARAAEVQLAVTRKLLEDGQVQLEARSRGYAEAFDAMTAAQERVAAEAASVRGNVEDVEHREVALRHERQELEDDRAELTRDREQFESQSSRLQEEMRRQTQELDSREKSVQERQTLLLQDVQKFEATRNEKMQWIASKDIELEALGHRLNEEEAAVRNQAEANARQLADLAAREEAHEIEGDRLEKLKADLGGRANQLDATAIALETRTEQIRELEARKAEEFRTWQETMESQQALLKDQREAFETESREARDATVKKRLEVEAFAREVSDREAQARAAIEQAMRMEDAARAREAAAADAIASANVVQEQVKAEREEVSRQTADLEVRERGMRDEADRRAKDVAAAEASLQTARAALEQQDADLRREWSAREAHVKQLEADAARKIEVLEEKSLAFITREGDLTSLQASVEQERADLGKLSQDIEAKRVEAAQIAERNGEEAVRLKQEEASWRQSLAEKEAWLRAEQERLERESHDLQDTLGARAAELAARAETLDAREREIVSRAQEAEAGSRELEYRERQYTAKSGELAAKEAALARMRADAEARAEGLEASAGRFAVEQEAKRKEWASLEQVLTTREAESKTEAEARLAEIAAKAAELEARAHEMSVLKAKIDEHAVHLADREGSAAARETEANASWARSEARAAELQAMEASLQERRQAFESERAAWEPRREQELKQLEATRDAAAEEARKAEALLEEAARRANVAAEAERSAKRKVDEASEAQTLLDGRRAEVERAESALENQSSQLHEAARKLAERELQVVNSAREVEARLARLDARTHDVSAAEEELNAKRTAWEQEAARVRTLGAELGAAKADLDSKVAEAKARLVGAGRVEQELKARETDVKNRGAALAAAERDVQARATDLSQRERSSEETSANDNRMRLEIEAMTAKADEDRRAAASAREEAESLRARAEHDKAKAEAQQAEVQKGMKFVQKKALETLDQEEKIRARAAELAEKDKILESQFEVVERKGASLELERAELAAKAAKLGAEVERLRARLAEAEQGSRPAADLEERNKDLERRLKIIQQKAMELLDREEKIRQREAELREQVEKLGIRP